jgi:hypothetical protein
MCRAEGEADNDLRARIVYFAQTGKKRVAPARGDSPSATWIDDPFAPEGEARVARLTPAPPDRASPGETLFYATTGHPRAVWQKMSEFHRNVWERKAQIL